MICGIFAYKERRKEKRKKITKSKFFPVVFSSLIEVSGTYTIDLAIV